MADENELFEEALAEDEAKVVDTRTIRDVVQAAVDLKLEVDDLEASVKVKKKALRFLLEETIPVKMNEIGTTELGFDIGNHKVSLGMEYKCRGTINSAPDIEAAVKYLVEHGFSGAVLTRASVDFKEGELDEGKMSTLSTIFGEEFEKDVHFDRSIHASTLMSFVRSQIEENPNFDPKIVGATVMREAKLTIK